MGAGVYRDGRSCICTVCSAPLWDKLFGGECFRATQPTL